MRERSLYDINEPLLSHEAHAISRMSRKIQKKSSDKEKKVRLSL